MEQSAKRKKYWRIIAICLAVMLLASIVSAVVKTDGGNTLIRSVYFAFDSYEVSPEYAAVVEAHAKWLAANPEVKIVIQGNTDERGGREYNLALGQKRSEAVLQRLQLLGIPSSRIEAVSFGKEKPIALGHSEEAWAQNRRADIVYPESVLKAQPAAK